MLNGSLAGHSHNPASVPANTDDFEETVAGVINEHSYTLVAGDLGQEEQDSDSEEQGGLEMDLPVGRHGGPLLHEACTPHREGEGSGASSPGDLLSSASIQQTDNDSPPCSPPDNDNIPDTQKYKNRMLVRYLNDAEEAQRYNNRKLSQTSGSQGTHGDFSSEDGEVFPDQSNLSVGQEVTYGPQDAAHSPSDTRYPPEMGYPQETGYPSETGYHQETLSSPGYSTPPTLQPETEQWQPVDGSLIPSPSNNITISFTHLPLEKDFVPVMTQPSRNDLGVDKVKRQLDMSSESPVRPQTVYVSLPTVPLPPTDQFSNGPPAPTAISSSPTSSPNKVFPVHSLRPPFLGSILPPGPFPFPWTPLSGWHPLPFPHFLHLAPPPDSSEYTTTLTAKDQTSGQILLPKSVRRLLIHSLCTMPTNFHLITKRLTRRPVNMVASRRVSQSAIEWKHIF